MSRGRRREIEVPSDTQSQFELGDTAGDIERRRRERKERERRWRGKGRRRGRERGWNERG